MEDNILIAEFMGFDPITEKYFEDNGFENDKQMIIDTSSCKYSTSWDWLMPVVENIESINIGNDEDKFYNVVIEGLECSIWLICKVGQTKIESTYKAVVAFIKWYNNNKN